MNTAVTPRVNVAKALELRFKGLTYEEIGKLQGGVSGPAICQALTRFKRFIENPEAIQSFRDNEAELLDGVRMELITSLVNDIRAKGKHALSGYQKVGMYGILFDKSRLLRGESTENIHSLTQHILAAHRLPPADPEPAQDVTAQDVGNEEDQALGRS